MRSVLPYLFARIGEDEDWEDIKMIRIKRGARFIDCLSPYKIYVGGVCRGRIWFNQTKEFPIENGNYTISAHSGRYRSNLVCVKKVDNSIIELEVGNALTGWKNWLFPYSELFIKKEEYLYLKERNPAHSGEREPDHLRPLGQPDPLARRQGI